MHKHTVGRAPLRLACPADRVRGEHERGDVIGTDVPGRIGHLIP
jgi:hypothetical protein